MLTVWHGETFCWLLILVSDPDGLLLDEGILTALEKMGFDVLLYDDPVKFRYKYEADFRSKWDRGEAAYLIVVVRGSLHKLRQLPYDILQKGHEVSFSLAEIFPKLSYPVLSNIEKCNLDKRTNILLGESKKTWFLLGFLL